MPVIQGGNITNDRSAALRQNFSDLANSLAQARATRTQEQQNELNNAIQASNLLNAEIERSGIPASVFMAQGFGDAYLDTIHQSLSRATGRQYTGNEALDAVNKLKGGLYNSYQIPYADRTKYLLGLIGYTDEGTPNPGSDAGAQIAQQAVPAQVQGQIPAQTPVILPTSMFGVGQPVVSGVPIESGAAGVSSAQGSTGGTEAGMVALGQPSPYQVQAVAPQQVTAPRVPVSGRPIEGAGIVSPNPYVQQVVPPGIESGRQGAVVSQAVPSEATMVGAVTGRVVPGSIQAGATLTSFQGIKSQDPQAILAAKVRDIVSKTGGDWSQLSDADVLAKSRTTTLGNDPDIDPSWQGKTLLSVATGNQTVDGKAYQVWEKATPRSLELEALPEGQTPSFQGGRRIMKMTGNEAADQAAIKARGLPMTAQAGIPDVKILTATDREFMSLVGANSIEEAKQKYPELYKVHELQGFRAARDRWQAYLNSNGLTQVGSSFLDAASGLPVSGPSDEFFKDNFLKVLDKPMQEVIKNLQVDTTAPATNVKEAAARVAAAQTDTKVAASKAPDELFFGKVKLADTRPALEANWLQKNAPKVAQTLDEFNKMLGNPTWDMKSKSIAYRAGVDAGNWFNAVWNKMTPQERKDHITSLLDYARNADIVTTELLLGKDTASNKLMKLEFDTRMAEAVSVSDTAQAKMLGDMLTNASENITNTFQNMNAFFGHVVTAAKNAGQEKNIDSFVKETPIFDSTFKNFSSFLENAFKNSGYEMTFTKLYDAWKSGFLGIGGRATYTVNPPATTGASATMSPDAKALAESLGL